MSLGMQFNFIERNGFLIFFLTPHILLFLSIIIYLLMNVMVAVTDRLGYKKLYYDYILSLKILWGLL